MALWWALKMAADSFMFSLSFDVVWFRQQWNDAGSDDFNRRREQCEIIAMLDKLEEKL